MSTSLEQRPLFFALTEFLPPEFQEEPEELWDIGEQEGALSGLATAFAESRTPITGLVRAWTAVLAECWGVLEEVTETLATCIDADADTDPDAGTDVDPDATIEEEDEDVLVALIENTDRGRSLAAELERSVGEGHPLTGTVLVPWIACRHCPDVLVRVHADEPWGPSFSAEQYVIIQLPGGGAPESPREPEFRSFDTGTAALEALESLHTPPPGR